MFNVPLRLSVPFLPLVSTTNRFMQIWTGQTWATLVSKVCQRTCSTAIPPAIFLIGSIQYFSFHMYVSGFAFITVVVQLVTFLKIIFQIPACILSKLYPPHYWMACAAIGWGICSTSMVSIRIWPYLDAGYWISQAAAFNMTGKKHLGFFFEVHLPPLTPAL